jgi:RES domain-containing protein
LPKGAVCLWRVFPFDSAAPAGKPFSAASVPSGQGAGRFDVPHLSPVWYLGESPAHAVAEVIQGLRNQLLDADDLVRFKKPLALAEAALTAPSIGRHANGIADLCDPRVLSEFKIRPDIVANSSISVTQPLAERLYEAGLTGFRWWSSLFGDWHTTILFDRRLGRGQLRFRTPETLTLRSDAVIEAAARLTIKLPHDKLRRATTSK